MEKKTKIIIGSTSAAVVLSATALGLGLGLGLKPNIIEQYVHYRKEFVKKGCTSLYEKNKQEWKPEYTDLIKASLTNPYDNLDTNLEWWKGGWEPFKWLNNPPYNNELYVSWYSPSAWDIGGGVWFPDLPNAGIVVDENSCWKFCSFPIKIMLYKDESTIDNPDPVLVSVTTDIIINK